MFRSTVHLVNFTAAALAAAVLATAAAAQNAQDDWGPLLTDQMSLEYDCEVAFFSQVAERDVNGQVIVIAKVHCQDKRTFDAYRPGSFELFEIHPCENPEHRVC